MGWPPFACWVCFQQHHGVHLCGQHIAQVSFHDICMLVCMTESLAMNVLYSDPQGGHEESINACNVCSCCWLCSEVVQVKVQL
mmetsp:Transcript_8095/g.24407  ORF Transcript_8095/g.24407 Transcript_8095/m.24407 type:complete len:83 (+) Transcript_8095:1251-1499(+)